MTTGPRDNRIGPGPQATPPAGPAGVPRPARGLGAGAWVVIAYLILDYGKPQYYLRVLDYVKPGLWIAVVGAGVLFFGVKRKLPREAWLVLAFIAVLALDIPFANNPRYAFNTTQSMLQMMVAGPFLMMVALDDVRRLRAAIWTYVLVGSYQGIQGILNSGEGIGGYFVDENDLCMLADTVIPLAYVLATTAPSMKSRVAGFVLMMVNVFAAVISFSRGGFLGLCAVLLCIILRSRRRVSTLLAIALALAVVYPLVPPTWFHEMGTIETAGEYGDTGETRLYMWGIAWKVFLDHPVFGVGGYNLGRHLPLYESQESGHAPLWGRVCHSLYFTLFAETGAVGTGIWIWIVASCFVTAAAVARQVVKKSKELQARDAAPPYEAKALVGMCRGLEAALIGFLAAGAFLTVNYYPVMWCLLGFIVAARLTLQNDPVLVGMMGAPSESSTGGQKLPRSASAGPGGGARLVSGSSPGPQVG